MNWKRRLLALGLLFVAGLALLHSQLVERAIWSRVVALAQEKGWALSASRFDLHLVPLGVSLRDLKVKGPGVDAQLDLLEAGAYLGLLTGSLDFKTVRLGRGVVRLDAEGLAKLPRSESEGEPPEIHADKLEIGSVSVSFANQQVPISLSAEDLRLAYSRRRLALGFRLAPGRVSSRELPQILLELGATTENFLEYREINLKLTSELSKITVNGRLGLNSEPALKARAELGADLLPEFPGLVLDGELDGKLLRLGLQGSYMLAGAPVPFALHAEVPYRESLIQIPVELESKDNAAGRLDLRLERKTLNLTGKLDLKGALAGLSPHLSELRLKGLELESDFALPGLELGKLEGQFRLALAARPELELSGTWRNGRLDYGGKLRLAAGSQLELKGEYDGLLHGRIEASLAKLSDLAPFWTPPAELFAQSAKLKAEIQGDFRTWTISDALLTVAEGGYLPYIRSRLELRGKGPLERLELELHAPALRANGACATAVMDLPALSWREIALDLETIPVPLGEYQLRARLAGRGSGQIVRSDFAGVLDVELEKSTAASLVQSFAHLRTKLALSKNLLDLKELDLKTAHGSLRGGLRLDLNQPLSKPVWSTKLVAEIERLESYSPFFETPLPLAEVEIEGNQAKLLARLVLEEQDYPLAGMVLPLALSEGAAFQYEPNRGKAGGRLPGVRVAGLRLKDLALDYSQNRLRAEADLELEQAAMLAEVLKPVGWPAELSLSRFSGQIAFDSGPDFKEIRTDLFVSDAEALYRGEPARIENLRASYGTRSGLLVSPFHLAFAGLALTLASADQPGVTSIPLEKRPADPFFDLVLGFQLRDPAALSRFLGSNWPAELALRQLSGSARLHTNADFSDRSQALRIDRLALDYGDHRIETEALQIRLEDSLWIEPFELQIDGKSVEVSRIDRGLQLSDLSVLDNWIPDLVGDARFDCDLQVLQKQEGLEVQLNLVQKTGKAVYLDPFLEIEKMRLSLLLTADGKLSILPSTALVNGGHLRLEGVIDLRAEIPEFNIELSGEQVALDLVDVQARLSSVLEWRGTLESSDLRGVLTVNDGYLSPRLDVEDLVQNLLADTTELYFPDPFLEKIRLQVVVFTEKPTILDTNLGYVEMESPALLIGGSLAEPMPISGALSFVDGSTLVQKNKTYLFQNSSIQFHPSRIGDPYLLLTIVEQSLDETPKTPIDINGYISDLNTSLDGSGIASFLLNYLLSKVSSVVSFEVEMSDDFLSKTSFTSVVSRTITPRLVVRYQIPYNQQNLSRSLELRAGPYYGNFVKIVDDEVGVTLGVSHLTRLGVKDRGLQMIRKITYLPEKPALNLRRHFQLRANEPFSETRWRRAGYDVRRALRLEGYFKPVLDYRFENGLLEIMLEKGKKTEIHVKMSDWNENDQRMLLGKIPADRELDLRHIERLCQRIAIAKGFPSAAAFAERENGERIEVRILVSHRVTQIDFDFGAAQPLLGELYGDVQKRKALLLEYFSDPSAAELRLRAQLAAKGYLMPELGRGDFIRPDLFRIPIKPGQRALITKVEVNGKAWESAYLGQPFAFSLLQKVVTELNQRLPGKQRITVRPVRDHANLHLVAKAVPIEEHVIQDFEIAGSERLTPEVVRRFFGRKPTLSQTELFEGQQKLVETRTFEMVRLQTGADNSARLELVERNPWDLTYGTTWSREEEFGFSTQFTDRMFLKRLAKLTTKVERTKQKDNFHLGVDVRRIFGTKFDYSLRGKTSSDRIPSKTEGLSIVPSVFTVTDTYLDNYGLEMSLSWKFGKRWGYDSGLSFKKENSSQVKSDYLSSDEDYNEDELLFRDILHVSTSRVALDGALTYQTLDNEITPRSGLYLSLVGKYLTNFGEDEDASGPWLLGRAAAYQPLGSRIIWSQFYEVGWYNRDVEDLPYELGTPEESDFFFLGGTKSVRGILKYRIGPLDVVTEDGKVLSITPMGGESMFHFTHEFVFDAHFNGLGFSPFIDGGWVWSKSNELFSTDLAVTGGVGLIWDLPIGRLRVDYAEILENKPYRPLTEDPDNPLSWDELGKALEQRWTLRFGRVF